MTTLDSHLALRALCDELARCGVTDACTSPGSRNTPILLALARERRIRCWSHVDERCAGFFALGAAKASGRPVAVTCTSGTAAANLAPAVVEAHHARVPLLVLTADRPAELREVGAGQAIDQLKLYGQAAKWFFELELAEATPERLRWVRALACRAYWTALAGRPGPVHLNLPLREPLVPDGPLPPDPVPGRSDGRPWRARRSAPDSTQAVPAPARTVVVAGQGAAGPGLARAAAETGLPLLADPLSGARHGATAVAHYDLLLREPELLGLPAPELVLRAGDLPTSKPLRAWLASLAATEQVALDERAAAQDPDASLTAVRPGGLPQRAGGAAEQSWLEGWLKADEAAARALGPELAGGVSEPWVAAELGRALPPQATLFVASSMPVRDVEAFFPARRPLARVLSNRGANGIDGTVSSAFGAAAVSGGPVVLLTGDLALLHDLGGLLAARRLGLSPTIVLLDNDGGGIFHFLPVSGQPDIFEPHVTTPHGVDLAAAAALFGLRHRPIDGHDAFREGLRNALAGAGPTLLHVRTDRRENLALHRRLSQAAAAALSRSAPAASHRA